MVGCGVMLFQQFVGINAYVVLSIIVTYNPH